MSKRIFFCIEVYEIFLTIKASCPTKYSQSAQSNRNLNENHQIETGQNIR